MILFYTNYLEATGDDKPLRDLYGKQLEQADTETERLGLCYDFAKNNTDEEEAVAEMIFSLTNDDGPSRRLVQRLWSDRLEKIGRD